MFGAYFGNYLFNKGIITSKTQEEMANYPYPMLSAQFEGTLKDNIAAFQADEQLTDEAMEALKAGVIDDIISKLALSESFENYNYNRFVTMVLKYIYVYISQNLVIKPMKRVKQYDGGIISHLKILGEQNFSISLAGEGQIEIAMSFMKKNYGDLNDEALAAANEFLNCMCGLFATELSHLDIDTDVEIPQTIRDKQLQTTGTIFHIPLLINCKQLDLLITEDGKETIV